MPSMLVAINAPTFAGEGKDSNGTALQLGEVYQTTKYCPGSHPASRFVYVQPRLVEMYNKFLGKDDDLYLITVRPGDIVWLVGVLRHPVFDQSGWTSPQKNIVPIIDITPLLPEIKLLSGKGIERSPSEIREELGRIMSWQRVLSPGDVKLLESAIKNAPIVPPVTTPVQEDSKVAPNIQHPVALRTKSQFTAGHLPPKRPALQGSGLAWQPSPEVAQFGEKLLECIKVNADHVFDPPLEGCSPAEVDAIEQEFNVLLPGTYRAFLGIAGKRLGNPRYDAALSINHHAARFKAAQKAAALLGVQLSEWDIVVAALDGVYAILDSAYGGSLYIRESRRDDFDLWFIPPRPSVHISYSKLILGNFIAMASIGKSTEQKETDIPMTVAEFHAKLLERIKSNAHHMYQQPIQGCDETEIADLELRYNAQLPFDYDLKGRVRLPAIYKEFLRVAGKALANPRYNRALTIRFYDERKQAARAIIAKTDSEDCVEGDYFVIIELDGIFFSTFSAATGDDDPYVFSFHPRLYSGYFRESRLSKFILGDFKPKPAKSDKAPYSSMQPVGEDINAIFNIGSGEYRVAEFQPKLLETFEANAHHIYDSPLEGCTEEEIRALEAKYNWQFPLFYREFLKQVGKQIGNERFHRALTVNFIDERNQRLRELVKSNHLTLGQPDSLWAVWDLDGRHFWVARMLPPSPRNDDPLLMNIYQKGTHAEMGENCRFSTCVLNDFKSEEFGFRLIDKPSTPGKLEPFAGEYARGWLKEGVTWPPAEVNNSKSLKPNASREGWIAPCYIGFAGTLDYPYTILLNAAGQKIENWNKKYIGEDEMAIALLKIAAAGLAEGIDAVQFEAMESHWGGFHLPGKEYAPLFAKQYGKVKVCKHCLHFLPVRNPTPEEDLGEAGGEENELDGKQNEEENEEYDEGLVGTGDVNVLPFWRIPATCPICKKKLVLVERPARRCVVTLDPTRQVQDLQEIQSSIQDSANAVPVRYEGQPYWTILYGTSLSMLLFRVVKEKQKRDPSSVAGIGPVLVLNTFTGLEAICPPVKSGVNIDFSRKMEEQIWRPEK